MNADVEELAVRAMGLSAEERIALAERLWASVDATGQAAISRAWADEAERRIDEIEAGQVGTIPADEVFARIEKKLRARGE